MNYDLNTEEGMKNSVAWTMRTLDSIKDGGAWGIPRSGTVVRVSHKDKTAYISDGNEPDVVRVLEAAGWTVKIEERQDELGQ